MAFNFLARNRYIILYGVCLSLLLFLLNWLKLRLIVLDHAFEVYIGSIALIFTALGIWLALKLTRPKVQTLVVEKVVYKSKSADCIINTAELEKLNISKREVEVLQLMAQGMSNQEIAEQLFVSLSTVKTHSNNLFEKLDVKRRTQAIEKARKLGLIP
ncbi:MAG TPA: response regulator transcription factor [Flavitalea sp.]|nr:response regulator transcription factor [Flavitalea sp.]